MRYDHWRNHTPDPDALDRFLGQGIRPLTAYFLLARGFKTPQDALAQLNVGLSSLHDPTLLPDMPLAVARIRKALDTSETIAIYGDYDADGVTASAILIRELRRLGGNVLFAIPDRLNEGYGMHIPILEKLKAEGATLIITVDTGIAAHDEIDFCNQNGIDVIVTDHHQCKETLPAAVAVVNAHRTGSAYPFSGLAGVGVAFKLAAALSGNTKDTLDRYGDLFALGTVADVVPVADENRVLISRGIRLMGARNPGIAALLRHPDLETRPRDPALISFALAPRVNAAGRLGKAGVALDLFLSDNPRECDVLAQTLCDLNLERQTIERELYDAALTDLNTEAPALVPAGKDWFSGVAGIVASRLASAYDRPTFFICIQSGEGRGSARSVPGINLLDILKEQSHFLTAYGGHAAAAGFTIAPENIPAFRAAVEAQCAQYPRETTLELDGCVNPAWLTQEAIEELLTLAPFGEGFAPPQFSLESLYVDRIVPLSAGKHVRIDLRDKNGTRVTALRFGQGLEDIIPDSVVDLAGRPELNRFRGAVYPQIHLTEIRLTADTAQCAAEFELYTRFSRGESITAEEARILLPDREDLAAFWRHLSKHQASVGGVTLQFLAFALRRAGGNFAKVWTSLDVLAEMNLVICENARSGRFNFYRNPHTGKIELDHSGIFSKLTHLAEGQPHPAPNRT